MSKGTILQNWLIVLLIGLFLLPSGVAIGQYSGGDGTESSPYRIAEVNDWQELMTEPNDWGSSFILTTDVNLAGVSLVPVGNGHIRFTGVFDGNDYVISNVVINQPSSSHVGLFGYVFDGEIRNLGVEDVNITGYNYVGGLVGLNYKDKKNNFRDGGLISNCYSTGNVNGTDYDVGGLVGRNLYGMLTVCHASGAVSGEDYVGGLMGNNYYGTLTGCYASGSVSGTGDYVGGLVGRNDGTLRACYANGAVSGYDSVGGLVGRDYGMLTGCYASGAVSGTSNLGGLAGRTSGTLIGCYASGSASGRESVGGLLGRNFGTLTACYASGSVSGTGAYVGGLSGKNYEGGTLIGCYATGSASGRDSVGGLVGKNYEGGTLTACYARGSVSGISYVGGLVGYNKSHIENCYSIGDVNGTDYNVGGLVGRDYLGTLMACFWDEETSGMSDGVGNDGPDPNGVTGKSSSEMKRLSTFTSVGWDFVGTWGIGENQTYPYLRKYSSCDINQDGKIDYRDYAIIADNWLGGI